MGMMHTHGSPIHEVLAFVLLLLGGVCMLAGYLMCRIACYQSRLKDAHAVNKQVMHQLTRYQDHFGDLPEEHHYGDIQEILE